VNGGEKFKGRPAVRVRVKRPKADKERAKGVQLPARRASERLARRVSVCSDGQAGKGSDMFHRVSNNQQKTNSAPPRGNIGSRLEERPNSYPVAATNRGVLTIFASYLNLHRKKKVKEKEERKNRAVREKS